MLTPEQLKGLDSKLAAPTNDSVSAKNAQYMANLRNTVDQQGQLDEYKQSPAGQDFVSKLAKAFNTVLGPTSNFLFQGLGKTTGGFVSDVTQGISNLQGKTNITPTIMNADKLRKKLGAGGQAVLETIPYSSIGDTLFNASTKIASPEFASKFPTLARYLGYGTLGATYGTGFGATHAAQRDDVTPENVMSDIFSGAVTGFIAGVAIPAIIEGTVRAVKNVTSLYSGVPKDALQQAFENPEKVGKAVRKYAQDSEETQSVLQKAEESFSQIKTTRQQNYQTALENLSNNIKVGEPLNPKIVSSRLNDMAQKVERATTGKLSGQFTNEAAQEIANLPTDNVFADDLYKQVVNVLDKYGLKDKVIGRGATISGGATIKGVSDTLLEDVQSSFKDILMGAKEGQPITMVGPQKIFVKNPETGVFEETKFTLQGLKSTLTKTLNDFNPKILPKSEQNNITELNDLIKNWDDITPLGLNELKQAIRNRMSPGNSAQLNRIYTTAESNLINYIKNRAPQIYEMNASYAEASSFIDKLQQEFFGKSSTMKDSTKLERLLGIFNQKNNLRQDLIAELGQKAGTDLLNEITGAAMSSWMPTGWVQRFVLGGGAGAALFSGVNPLTVAAGATLASPRIIGKGARVLGQITQNILPEASRIAPVALRSIIDALNKQNNP